jgi:signal transduction histidine kinase
MHSLRFRLILAFLVVSLTGTALVALFARRFTATEFDRYILDQAQEDFISYVSTYYQTTRSWRGVETQLPYQPNVPQVNPTDGKRLPPQPPFALADQTGRIVVPMEPYRMGERVPEDKLAQGIPIEIDEQIAGTVLSIGPLPERDTSEMRYLARMNQAQLNAALGATGLALVLALILARALTRPLRELTSATRRMAKGELNQQVPVRSRDELGELAAAFNQMSADLARANDQRRQMVADIAHDLRSPLTVISGYLESLRDGALTPSTERFAIMYNEAQHLRCLVEDLRTLSLADAGSLPLDRHPMSPKTLLERAAAAHRHQAEQKDITLTVEVGDELPEIDVDPERMAQVLGNLVSNALRYTSPGGQIRLSAAQKEHCVLLSIQDDGVGIAPDKLPRIFDRLYRGDESRQAHEGELGLGLAIAKSLVELHGGNISVESTLGEGTTFTIAMQTLD